MGWFNRSPRKKDAPDIPPGLFAVCPRCKAHTYKEEYERAFRVCPKCSHHERLSAAERIQLIVDKDSFREFNQDITTNDPLSFHDAKGTYREKAEQAKIKTGLNEAVVTGSANIDGIRTVIAVMDFRFLGGSLASGTGEKILLAAEHALRMKRAFLVFSASGGARMHEGIVSLMQMAKTCAGISRLNRAGLPYISILTDPTYGGVSASYAMVGDINIAEPGALIGFAGRRVIEQTIKEQLPDDFQTAEYLLEHGFVDAIVHRADMKQYLSTILKYALRKSA